MKFIIGVVDRKTGRVIVEGARVGHIGVMVFLERLTDLNERERNKFLRDLIGLGVAEHVAEATDELSFNIAAVKV